LRQLVRASRDLQLINLANELKLRCETQLGEMLRNTHLSKGGRPSKTIPDTRNGFTLRELGIDKNLSSWCQRLANAPKDKFERVMAEARTGEWELTRHTLKKFLIESPPKDPKGDEEVKAQYRCPACGFSWRGKPK
jgi:rubredoxin